MTTKSGVVEHTQPSPLSSGQPGPDGERGTLRRSYRSIGRRCPREWEWWRMAPAASRNPS